MFLLYYFLFLDKTYHNQNQGFINVRSSHWRCSVRKSVLRNFGNFTEKNLCWSLVLVKLQAFRPVCLNSVKLWLFLSIFTWTKQTCFFSLLPYHRLKVLKNCSLFFLFFLYFYKLFAHFLVKRLCIRLCCWKC